MPLGGRLGCWPSSRTSTCLHYDWSDPNRVVLTTTDFNIYGTTDIDLAVVRDGQNLKGWVLGLVLGTIGRRVVEKAFEHAVKAIEARNGERKMHV